MGFFTTLAQHSYDDSYYSTTNTVSDEAAAAAMVGIMLFVFTFSLLFYVFFAFMLGLIFKKAGVPQWAAWVPFYNNWKLLEIGGQQGFWAILTIIPVINIVSAVFMYIAMYNIGLKLGKEGIFVLLAIFLTPAWLIWLAVDKSAWNDAAGAPRLDTPVVPPATPSA